MIFVGDIALGEVNIEMEFPDIFFKNKVIANLEGGINTDLKKKNNIVFNSKKNCSLFSKFYLFTLANNHLLDVNKINETLNILDEIKVPYTGLIKNGKHLFYEDNEYVYLNFGWNVIRARGKKSGFKINPLIPEYVINEVVKIKNNNKKKIICIFHWGYELDLYPQPVHRELSHILIDKGVSLIIGHHSHRVQGIEIYKNKPIVYGLGNFLFIQNYFVNKNLCFPDFCSEQIAFEYTDSGEHYVHWLYYEKERKKLKYLKKEELKNSKEIYELTPFSGMSNNDYKKWFKSNRTQKKLLPIYYFEDGVVIRKIKDIWIYFRHIGIIILIKIKFKK